MGFEPTPHGFLWPADLIQTVVLPLNYKPTKNNGIIELPYCQWGGLYIQVVCVQVRATDQPDHVLVLPKP
jgi:hypothetical protein